MPTIEIGEFPAGATVSMIASVLENNSVIHTLYLDYKGVLPGSLLLLLNSVKKTLRRLSVRVHSASLLKVIATIRLPFLEELTLSHCNFTRAALAFLYSILDSFPRLCTLTIYDPLKGERLLKELPDLLAPGIHCIDTLKLLHMKCDLDGQQSWGFLKTLCLKVNLKYLHWEVISDEYTPFVNMINVLFTTTVRKLLIRAAMSDNLAAEVYDLLCKMPLTVTLIGLTLAQQKSVLQQLESKGAQPHLSAGGLICRILARSGSIGGQ
jgi:hypothetical protein